MARRKDFNEQIYAWIREFACRTGDPDNTPTSMFGGREWSTPSGEFRFAETSEVQGRLFESITKFYDMGR